MAKSLLEKAEKRIKFIKKSEISEDSAQFILEECYEALRESAQSLMTLKGYKPYSHEATISFVREFYSFSEEEISKFDRFRQIRSNSVYRALEVSKSDAEDCLEFAGSFVSKVGKAFEG